MLKIGTVIDGKYKILSEVGHGGMSTVYLAINEKANKTWAVKEVRKLGVKNVEVVRQSLLVEMDLLKKLKHPNLPSIVDVIDDEDNFLIVMDFIEGNTLEKMLLDQGAQKQEDVVEWALQLCDVLSYLHQREPAIIYRDMKPSNIMLQSDNRVILIDFGTAREYKQEKSTDTTCLGTQGYAAPEQFGGHGQTDARTDIYCLGATMYHLVTGHNPSNPPYEMYPIRYWNSQLSSGLEYIISKCTQKNPQDRYQSVDELTYALKHYRDLDETTMQKNKRKLYSFLGTCALAVVCLSVGVILQFMAVGKQQEEYIYALQLAQRTTNDEETMNAYMRAIQINPLGQEAYQGIYEQAIEDGIFTIEEEVYLLQLLADTEKKLQKFAAQKPDAYADFCFSIGNAYWFYYEQEESRQANAVSWFATAMELYSQKEERQVEYRRCELYVEIGNFYKKLLAVQREGADVGIYANYWKNLVMLKASYDENPDRDVITLRMYQEMITRSMEYAKYLQEDGITKQELLEVYDEILANTMQMRSYANAMLLEEIRNVEQLMDMAQKLINSVFI